ncbi:hypothetical protein [Pulveribacter suum]|uniref:hypothetical protein n=1 Tax=Pulveribacter suum TaxID=2116657 RepID=UPI0013006A90|nr:hypothetical protein [Pulveribacter suum]
MATVEKRPLRRGLKVSELLHILLAFLALVIPMLIAWLLVSLPDLRRRRSRRSQGQ